MDLWVLVSLEQLRVDQDGALGVLDATVALVDDQVPEVDSTQALQQRLVLDHFVRGDHCVVTVEVGKQVFPDPVPLLAVRRVHLDHPQLRAPPPKFRHPRGEHAQRADDEARAAHVQLELEEAQERDRLHRLPKAHLVPQDAVHTVLEGFDQPVHAWRGRPD
jgi:hypothetical protein